MSVTVVATFVPLPELRAEVIDVLEDMIAAVHADDKGCELYALQEGEDRLVMIEKWASPELLEAHSRGATVAKFGPRLAGKMEGAPDVQVFQPHPAGTAQQGSV